MAAIAGLVFFLGTRGFVPPAVGMAALVVGMIAAGMVLFAWIRHGSTRTPS